MRLAWSSKQQLTALLALALLGACTDDAVPTSTAAQSTSGTAPKIQNIDVTPSGANQVILKVTASNPLGGTLKFAWTVSNGDLSTKTGPSTVWRTPTQPGTYTASVTATNTKNETVTGSQTFTVGADGKASAVGAFQTATAVGTNASTSSAGTGQFSVPTAVAQNAGTPVIVAGGVGVPVTTAQPVLTPPPANPAATPLPVPTPALPPLQPIATPTPTQPPPSVPPSPAPTPKPPTPKPGVPAPAVSLWVQVDPARVATTRGLNAVFFLPGAGNDFKEGWAAGESSALIHTTDAGQNWEAVVSDLPVGMYLVDVVFTSSTNGFVGASDGRIFKTSDSGKTWKAMPLPPLSTSALNNLVVFNDQIVQASNQTGQVYRTENANGNTVTWTKIDTAPPTHTGDAASFITTGTAFNGQNDTTLSFYGGDNIYKLDTDSADPAQQWKVKVRLSAVNNTQAWSSDMPDANNIWFGTSSGVIYHSADAGNNWTAIDKFFNREHNGTDYYLHPSRFSKIQFTDPNDGFVLTDNAQVLDTTDAGASWKATALPGAANDMQVVRTVNAANNQTEFIGWAVGSFGRVMRLTPNPNP